MGKLLHMPSVDQKERVRNLVRIGTAEQDIADELQIPLKRLQKRFRRELEKASAEGKTGVLQKLYDMATSGSNTTATIFWVKAKCGWRDTGAAPVAPQAWPPFIVHCE